MIKFFRKHNKKLLVIVTVFLMVVFIGGQALSSMLSPNPAQQQIGWAFGKPLTQADRISAESQTTILARLGYGWNVPWGLTGRLQPLNVIEYLLLLRECEEKGFAPSLEQARMQQTLIRIDLNKFSLDTRVPIQDIELAVANYLSILQMWSAAQGSALPSELAVHQAIREQYQKLKANIVEVRSEPLIDLDQAISDAELQAHFDKYREQTAGEDALEFGYLIADRVQVEYIAINTDKVTLSQPITHKQAEDYWRDHQAEFDRPQPDEAEEQIDEPDPDVEGPELPDEERSPYYETFDAAREDVLEHLRGQRKLEEARGMASTIWRALREPWYNQIEDEAGFPGIPEAARAPDHYQKIVERLAPNISHGQAIEFGKTELFARDEAADQPPIGDTREDTQSNIPGRRFGQDTHWVQGLVEQASPDGSASAQALALYQTATAPMIDGDNNLYLYRVIRTEKRRPPQSLDEVRDKVAADLRSWRAYEQAKSHAQAIEALIHEKGIQEAWQAYDGLVEGDKAKSVSFFESNPFPRLKPEILPGFRFPVIVSDKGGARGDDGKLLHSINREEFVAGAFKLLAEGGADGIGIIEVPAMQRVFAVQLAGLDLISATEYESQKLSVRQQLTRSRMEILLIEWFSGDRIRDRCGFKPFREGA